MSDLRCPKLEKSLQLAYSAERAAAFAYIGHAQSLKSSEEARHVQQIEKDEWDHRREVKAIMDAHDIPVSRWLEWKFWCIGKTISLSCHLVGRFMPYFFAGKLESGNVCEYFVMIRRFRELGHTRHDDCLYEMGVREKEHEIYFLGMVQNEPWLPYFEKVFSWGVETSANDVELGDLLGKERAEDYCQKFKPAVR